MDVRVERNNMASSSPHDPEKGAEPDVNQRSSMGEGQHKFSLGGRRTSVAESVMAGDLLDERYNITQRGLKSRHAQMIALGGTIGTGYVRQFISSSFSQGSTSGWEQKMGDIALRPSQSIALLTPSQQSLCGLW